MPDTAYAIHIRNDSGNIAGVVFRTPATVPVDGTTGSTGNRLQIPHFTDNGYGDLPSASTIVSATAATPIVATVTTGEGANFAANDVVLVTGGLGDPNINGTFFVTVAGDALTLVGSATDGTYTANSAKVRKLNKAKSYHIALAGIMAAILNDRAAGN